MQRMKAYAASSTRHAVSVGSATGHLEMSNVVRCSKLEMDSLIHYYMGCIVPARHTVDRDVERGKADQFDNIEGLRRLQVQQL